VSPIGLTLLLGPAIVAPELPVGASRDDPDWLYLWQREYIEEAVNESDGWGVIAQRPDMDYRLFDVDNLDAAARYGTRAWVILGRES
jgi:hypothetical protein